MFVKEFSCLFSQVAYSIAQYVRKEATIFCLDTFAIYALCTAVQRGILAHFQTDFLPLTVLEVLAA
jgi:hypothetical protein